MTLNDQLVTQLDHLDLVLLDLLDVGLVDGLAPLLQLLARHLLRGHLDEPARAQPPRNDLPEEAVIFWVLYIKHEPTILRFILHAYLFIVQMVKLVLDLPHQLCQLVRRDRGDRVLALALLVAGGRRGLLTLLDPTLDGVGQTLDHVLAHRLRIGRRSGRRLRDLAFY